MSVKFEIHPCPFESRPCDNWGCTNAFGVKKYFIGRPDASIPKPIFCESCIRHMIANVPVELVDGADELEVRLRAEIEQEYEQRLEQTRIELGFGVVDRQSLTEALQDGDVTATNDINVGTISVDGNGNVEATGATITKELQDVMEPRFRDEYDEMMKRELEENVLPPTDQPQIFRCLDCGKEYDSAAKLGSHRRVHKEG